MTKSVHEFTVKTIDGAEKKLSDYEGKVLLVVNVASECGLTPQYKGLEELHEKYAAKGLRVLGFPANEFGAQEPGSDAEIKTFCESKFGVKFDMFSKVKVKGDGVHPLFDYLQTDPAAGGAIKWNFHKFLVGKDGRVIAGFGSKLEPNDPDLTKAIETALG